jgi:predicted amidohydrolase
VNRVGDDPRFSYSGDSLIVDPLGEVLADAEPGVEAVLIADVEPERVAVVRAEFPFLQDRRGR